MKYPATMIQAEGFEAAVYSRPAVNGWEVVCKTQPRPPAEGQAYTWIHTVKRKREIAAKVQECINAILDSVAKAHAELGEEEFEVTMATGTIDDLEMVH